MISTVPPEDEYIHKDFPRAEDRVWKENWYFNFIDRKNNAWGMNHISLHRHVQKGVFRALHVVDDDTLFYQNEIDLTDDFSALTDGRIAVEILEPHRKHRLTFQGETHTLDLTYEARFAVFDYEKHDRKGGFDDKDRLAIEHYEQGMAVTGTLTRDGAGRPISGLGHRDHSWGYRNEDNIEGWNWVAVQFPEKTVNLSIVNLSESMSVSSGFISTTNGNIGVREVRIRSTQRDDASAPIASTFAFVDETGQQWTLSSNRFSNIYIPLKEKKGGVVHENFSEFKLVETGETGLGVDEYMERANG